VTTPRREVRVAFAIGAHPDDIEYYMAGTLLMLQGSGYEIHMMNLSSGNGGSVEFNGPTTARKRRAEAKEAAALMGATWHPPICNDMEVLYETATLRRLAAVVREVGPSVVLTHSPEDYMEDHMNTSRLAVSAAFARGAPNYETDPLRAISDREVTIYHGMPHGLRDGLRRRIIPGAFVDTTTVHETKRDALAAHVSQKSWLDASQGMDSYVQAMEEYSLEVGRMSGVFEHAEGWRRHSHIGFSATDIDPLLATLGESCAINADYERLLEGGL
jgi:LmbE family N-acetylglucosaminyl deacetylase